MVTSSICIRENGNGMVETRHKNYVAYVNKKLSYRRETARQLPHGGRVGLDPAAPSPPLPLATPMRTGMAESESHNVRTSSVPSVKCTLR